MWKLSTVMKIHNCDKILHFYEFHYFEENSSYEWKFIIVMKIHSFEDDSFLINHFEDFHNNLN